MLNALKFTCIACNHSFTVFVKSADAGFLLPDTSMLLTVLSAAV